MQIFPNLPHNICSDLVEFFNVDEDVFIHSKPDLSLRAFIKQYPNFEFNDVTKLSLILNTLVNKGVLMLALDGMVLDRQYLACEVPSKGGYGTYDFLVGGPLSIFNAFKDSVIPVSVTLASGDHDIGTAFIVANGGGLCTARHNIENKKEIIFRDAGNNIHEPNQIFFHQNERVDLALLVFTSNPFLEKSFRFSEPVITENVVVMGYPPVAGFDSLLLIETGEVSAQIKTAAGQVVGSGQSYLDSQDYYLINARVKGGSSGAPVISERGFVNGVICNTSLTTEQSDQISGMGYGLALSGITMHQMCKSVSLSDGCIKSIPFKPLPSGGITTIC